MMAINENLVHNMYKIITLRSLISLARARFAESSDPFPGPASIIFIILIFGSGLFTESDDFPFESSSCSLFPPKPGKMLADVQHITTARIMKT